MPKLTKRVVESLQPGQKYTIVWDSVLPGFGVRVWPSGRRVYVLQYRTKESMGRRKTIGRHGALTAEQARTIAQQWLAQVSQGGDPLVEQKTFQKSPTVAQLAARYMAEHATVKKKPGSIRPDDYNLRCHVLPALGQKKVVAVTRADIATLHHAMRETPGAANRVLALLSKMFTLVEQWGLRPEGSNPVRHIERYRERRFERFLSVEEFVRLGDALAEAERTQTEYASVIAAIRLLIFTGARLSEILELRWEQVDFAHACVRLPDSKSGAKLIYLSPPALEVLYGIEPHESNPYVIVGREPCSHQVRAHWERMQNRLHYSVKEAAYQVMVQAYLIASGHGTYPANARQIMYAARPLVQELTHGKCWKHSSYFTQTLLPDFLEQHPELTARWDVVFDARGHLFEPHTDYQLGLGTLEVRQYLQEW
jgi:integrase